MKKVLITLFWIAIMSPLSFGDTIKNPNVAGQFYPAEPLKLSRQIQTFMDAVKAPEPSRDTEILISPHAGYVYSGGVAAYGFKSVSSQAYKTVVILAPSHHYGFDGVSVWPQGGFRTPLGILEVDTEFAQKLITLNKKFGFFPKAFAPEHALEVQLPFLQQTFKGFKIVPVIVGQASFELTNELADGLDKLIGDRKDILVVVSSDMSHYHDDATARKMDQDAIKLIQALDVQSFWDQSQSRAIEMCGFVPVTTALLLAKKRNLSVEVLRYANSGDVTGDTSQVVGYSSVAFYKSTQVEKKDPPPQQKADSGVNALNASQKKRLLGITRQTIEDFVRNGKTKEFKESDPRLSEAEGAFVTIHKKGALRGCIGNIVTTAPLYQTVRNMAIAAASEDPRFTPVSEKELGDIDVEISVLSKPRRTMDVNEIQMGVHGVIVSRRTARGMAQGVFLPQVGTETGWSREEFLSQLCAQKAGLPPNAWKDPQTEIRIFTADVFSEKEMK